VVLRPRATLDVPLTAVLPDRVLAHSGDRALQMQVSASYQSLRLPRTEKAEARFIAYAPGAIDWSRGMAQAAAWVTTRDPMVEAVARAAVRGIGPASGTSGIRNIDFTAAVFDAVEVMGVTYVPDPTNPYSTISGTPKAVDTIFYPRETLARGAGDCDDTSVLFAALLGNVGIHTRFVGVPGHIFLLVDTDVHERNRLALGLDERLFVVLDDAVWIPLETTSLGKGFAEAWRAGAEAYASWAARGQIETVDVAESQVRFGPGDLPGEVPVPGLPMEKVVTRVHGDLAILGQWRSDYFTSQFGGLGDSLVTSAEALNEMARVYLSAGRLREAGDALARALALDPQSARTRNNLGVIAVALGDLAGARADFQTVTSLDTKDPGPWLNLGLASYATGDSTGAESAAAQGMSLSGGYAQACALLGMAPEENHATLEGPAQMTAAEARLLLLRAMSRVPAAPSTPVPTPIAPAARPWKSRIAGGRGAESPELSDLLYWKP
jgi:tetratricopeptide (TPR) repeat protein